MEKLKILALKIKWFIMDVDGVLTDGGIIYDSDGRELKKFCVRDGMGITLLHNAGIKTAVLTSRNSPMVKKRAQELNITEVIQGASDKLRLYEKIKKKHNVLDEEVLYIGDDYVDLPVLRRVGFPVTVPGAPEELKEVCVYVTQKQGGDGAVREVAELLLKLSGKFEEAVRRYID
ncbi:HAD hydrolase family protein [Persephonella atlantica]|uniref:HAD hydrolase family protein n=2 Tax=Persephonella atlantica TaxID=2699429 RepID=A0ABS1GKQ7_9AQUI|nr:HAD family hydrolase [Persephonella atlantica]MBK3333297.1 HAD hydrolase family protein [Persephonella atlantica]